MAYDLVTKNGRNMYDMASIMQKAIRRCNPNLARQITNLNFFRK